MCACVSVCVSVCVCLCVSVCVCLYPNKMISVLLVQIFFLLLRGSLGVTHHLTIVTFLHALRSTASGMSAALLLSDRRSVAAAGRAVVECL